MAIDGHRSTFNADNNWTLDNLQEMFDLSPALLADAQEYQSLLTTANKTQVQIDRLNVLTTELQSFIVNAEKWNYFLDCLYNMENFMVTNVEGYVETKQAEFDATLQKFSNKGVWSGLVTFQQWNTCSYNYETFMSLQDNNLNHTPVGDETDAWWQKMANRGSQGQAGIGLSWLGTYNNATSYTVGNAVGYNNNIYYCTTASLGNLPTDTSYWSLFMSDSGILIQSSDPESPYLHMIYVNSGNKNIKYWDGTEWQICSVPASGISLSDSGSIITANNVEDALQEIVTNLNTYTSNKAIVNNALISTTATTNVLSYTPTVQGNFNIGIYFRVITGTTNVTITVTYTDNTGTQTNTLLSVQPCAIGSYSTLPLYINARTTGAITISVAASVASRVYVSASIQGV